MITVLPELRHTEFVGFTAWASEPQEFTVGERVMFSGVIINEGAAYSQGNSTFVCPTQASTDHRIYTGKSYLCLPHSGKYLSQTILYSGQQLQTLLPSFCPKLFRTFLAGSDL